MPGTYSAAYSIHMFSGLLFISPACAFDENTFGAPSVIRVAPELGLKTWWLRLCCNAQPTLNHPPHYLRHRLCIFEGAHAQLFWLLEEQLGALQKTTMAHATVMPTTGKWYLNLALGSRLISSRGILGSYASSGKVRSVEASEAMRWLF